MQTMDEEESVGTIAVRNLRKEKLRNGVPFMINSNELPEGQCYLEYPDGTMHLVFITTGDKDFNILRILTQQEEEAIRKKYNLF